MIKKKLWFRAKRFGWGWTPISWEGWVIMLLYLIGTIGYFIDADRYSHSGSDTLISFAIPFIINTIFLLIICYTRGEKFGWKWG